MSFSTPSKFRLHIFKWTIFSLIFSADNNNNTKTWNVCKADFIPLIYMQMVGQRFARNPTFYVVCLLHYYHSEITAKQRKVNVFPGKIAQF